MGCPTDVHPGPAHVAADPAGVEVPSASLRVSLVALIGAPPDAGGDGRRRCELVAALLTAHRPAARTAHTATANRLASSRTAATNHTPHPESVAVGAVGDHDAPSRSAGFQFDG